MEVLKWLRSEGCPWDASACKEAALGGNLEVLRWLRSEGCPWDERTWEYAADSTTREWLKENGYPQNLIDANDDEYNDDEYSDDYSEDDE